MIEDHKRRDPWFYQRTFIADLAGKPCGLMQLKFHGDKEDSK